MDPAGSNGRPGRWLAGVAGLAAVVAAIWIWSASRVTPLPERGADPEAAAAQPELAAQSAPLASPQPDARAPAPAAAPTATAQKPQSSAAASEPVDVLVVEKSSGAPVAGAEVRWGNWAELPLRADPARPRWRSDPEQRLAHGHKTTSDASGIARIDARVFDGSIVARRGEAWGAAFANVSSPRPIRVEIAPDSPLVLQVVDGAGRPVAGVPVGLRTSEQPSLGGCFWRGTTDGPEGLARVRRIEPPRAQGPGETQIFACIDALAPSAGVVRIDPANLPAETVRLVLPPTGSIVLSVHDAEGAPLEPMGTNLALASQAGVDGSLDWGAPTFEAERIAAGRVEYPFVEVGLQVYVDAILFARHAKATGPGPAHAGEVVTFDLDVGPPAPRIIGRLVDERGEPLRDQRIGFHAQFARRGQLSTPSKTDAKGRFCLDLPFATGEPLQVSLRVTPHGPRFAGSEQVELELDLPSAPPVTDLGDLRVVAPSVLASGRVVDQFGQPVADAAISVEFPAPGAPDGSWIRSSIVDVVRTSGGAFQVLGSTRPARILLRASWRSAAAGEAVVVEPGATDVELVVLRTSRISGRLILDPDVDPASVVVSLDWERLPRRVMRPPASTRARADGTFLLSDVPLGPCRVRFGVGDGRTHVLEFDDVEVPVHGSAQDARLDAVDLRGML